MASYKHGLGVSISPERGLHVWFKGKPSAGNVCIGDELRGKKYASRTAQRAAFKSAAAKCK